MQQTRRAECNRLKEMDTTDQKRWIQQTRRDGYNSLEEMDIQQSRRDGYNSLEEMDTQQANKIIMSKTYTITAALPYANGPIHIGHVAGAYLPADIYARYQRQCGHRVLFISGTDEHGVPITLRAEQEGVSPQIIVDRYHKQCKESLIGLGISFDIFDRTSSAQHRETAQNFFTVLNDSGSLIKLNTEQYFDPCRNQFLSDRYITGTCPRCQVPGAYGDQCEACGSTLSPEELQNPRSILSGSTPIKRLTKHWYLRLDKHTEWLRKWILEQHAEDWKPHVLSQCKSWLDQGLRPRAVTRDLDWGIPVPLDEAKGKVLYVWFDAPIGYISATKAWANLHNQDWRDFWQNPEALLIHFIGKDNIVFHCIIFPVMLHAHGGYILPQNVPANAFLNLEGRKLSTSKNWAVWLHEYLETFPGQQDVLRYTLCANAPEQRDSDFTWEDLQAKNNNELVAILGNVINRTLVLVHKYCGGRVPCAGLLTETDRICLLEARKLPIRIGKAIDQYSMREGLKLYMEIARIVNKYLTESEPWKVVKTDPHRAGTILYVALQAIGILGVVGHPFLPFTTTKICQLLRMPQDISWSHSTDTELLPVGTKLALPELLFKHIDDSVISAQKQRLVNESV